MTDLAADPRVIDAEAPQSTTPARAARGRDGVARLFLGPLRRRADAVRARPVHDDRGHGRRARSSSGRIPWRRRRSPPATDGYEFYVRLVQGGTLHAAAVADADRPGDADDRPEGQVPAPARRRADAHLHLVGHGQRAVRLDDAPDAGRRRRRARPSSSTASRTPTSSATASIVEGWERSGEYPVTFIPTVSRPNDPVNAAWMGRTGRVETILGPVLDELGLTPANSIAYICGNPDMILSRRGDAPRPRLPRGAGPQGALLAEGQGAARRRRRGGPRRRDRRRRGERGPVGRRPHFPGATNREARNSSIGWAVEPVVAGRRGSRRSPGRT